jgi:hypothetical protein
MRCQHYVLVTITNNRNLHISRDESKGVDRLVLNAIPLFLGLLYYCLAAFGSGASIMLAQSNHTHLFIVIFHGHKLYLTQGMLTLKTDLVNMLVPHT